MKEGGDEEGSFIKKETAHEDVRPLGRRDTDACCSRGVEGREDGIGELKMRKDEKRERG